MEENKLIEKSIEVLIKEIEPAEILRFLNLPHRRRIESVKRHRQWQKKLNKETFLNEVFKD